jgi:adenosylhomocysteinase
MTEEKFTESGNMKMEWAKNHMPVLAIIKDKFEKEKPLNGLKVGMALHVEAKTAVLVETLVAGGAKVFITGCNPLSTQDDVAKALDTRENIDCFAKYGCCNSEYYEAIDFTKKGSTCFRIFSEAARKQLQEFTGFMQWKKKVP